MAIKGKKMAAVQLETRVIIIYTALSDAGCNSEKWSDTNIPFHEPVFITYTYQDAARNKSLIFH